VSATVKELFCPRCVRVTFHDRRGNGFACLERNCGWITRATDLGSSLTHTSGEVASSRGESSRGESSRGESSRGESGRGVSYSSKPANAYTTSAYTERLRGDDLAAVDRDPEFARFVLARAGLQLGEEEVQNLVIGDLTVSVRVWVDDHGMYVVRPVGDGVTAVFPETKVRALKLGQLYASLVAGQVICPSGPALARWKRRALTEEGGVQPPEVHLRRLPTDAPEHAVRIWEPIGLLLAVRLMTEPDDRLVPLNWTFVARWSGCDENTARRGLGWLERKRYIAKAATVDVRKPRPLTLWWIAEERGDD
jgi:hypothetical protein